MRAVGIGLMLIASATHSYAVARGEAWFVERQGIFFGINVLLVIFCLRFDYRLLQQIAKPLYIFNLVLLLAVMFVGHSALGAQRWIQIGPVTIQPSEFAKAIIIICLAAFLAKRAELYTDFTDYLPAVAYVFVPFVLVMRQPDLGTSLVFAVITLGMLIISGFKMRWLAILSGAFVVLLPAFWMILKEYQKNRIRVFLDPELDPFGAGYHVIQSKIAIGSGLLTGKGWFSGTQSQLNFLPENHTDFVFAVAGEEFGFIGVCVILFLYGIIIWRGLTIALNAEDDFGTLLAVGITFMFTFHMFVKHWHDSRHNACNRHTAAVFKLRRKLASTNMFWWGFCLTYACASSSCNFEEEEREQRTDDRYFKQCCQTGTLYRR